MKFFCCHCGLHIECDDSMAGTEASCPGCQGPVAVPARALVAVRPLQFFCTHCGVRIECEPSMAGMETPCPDCQAPLTIPLPFGGAAGLPVVAQEENGAIPAVVGSEAAVLAGPLPPFFATGDQQDASPVPPPVMPVPGPPPRKGLAGHIAACIFIGLLLLLCLLLGVTALLLTLLNLGNRAGVRVETYFYFLLGVIFLWVGSLLLRGYRHSHRRALACPLNEYRGAFGLRMKPTERNAGLFMGAGILLSFACVVPLPVVGMLPAAFAATLAFAIAFDLGLQRKLLRKLGKEKRMAALASPAQGVAPEWGQDAEVPDMLQKSRPVSLPSLSKRLLWGIGVAGAAFLLLLLLLTQAWPHYQWASMANSVKSHQFFLERFPEGSLSDRAREKLHHLMAEETWASAVKHHSIAYARNYLRDYPAGQRCDEARAMIAEQIEVQWGFVTEYSPSDASIRDFLKAHPEASLDVVARAHALQDKIGAENYRRLSASRSEEEILAYLEEHPDAPYSSAIKIHLGKLYDDWEWVKKQDSLEHYRRFVSNFPKHPRKEWIEARIIDLEVAEIAAGEHGKLPPVKPQQVGGSVVEIEVKNDTGYPLTLRYSGPDSKMLVLPVGKSGKATLLPGKYRVAGSVAGANVRNYYGTETMEGGFYGWNFFIKYE